MSENFGSVVICDFEYEITAGDLPVVLCMVAYVLDENLRHVHTIKLWRGEFGTAPPFDIGPNTLFVAYSAWAEMTCFKVLGWTFPVHTFDQHTAFLAVSNILLPYNPDETRKKLRKRLSDACRIYGIKGWETIDKEAISEAIGNGTWREKYSPQDVVEYCEEDVRMSTKLLRAQLRGRAKLPAVNVERILNWSNYSAKAIALIQARGMPIDMVLWNLVQENKAAVIAALIKQFDPSYGSPCPIYTPEGEWGYRRFEQWLVYAGVTAWPRLESGQLDTDSDAFRMMYHERGIEGLHALRDSLGFIAKARLPRCSMHCTGSEANFVISNELAEIFDWRLSRFAEARRELVRSGYLTVVRPAHRKRPAVYCWASYPETPALAGSGRSRKARKAPRTPRAGRRYRALRR